MPLEFEVNAQKGMKMKMTATSVSKESVPAAKFDIPNDYKEQLSRICKRTCKR